MNLSPSAEGPRMTACTLQQAPTPGSVSDAQFNFPADDGSTVKLGMWQDSTVPATITQGDELRGGVQLFGGRGRAAPHENHYLLPL